MMIEPTESENLEEINRFCEAMISIKNEINEIAEGIADVDNVIKNSPHTINMLTSEKWNHSYSREKLRSQCIGSDKINFGPLLEELMRVTETEI